MAITKKGSDPSRADRKAKKRKLEDAVPDLPGDNEAEERTPSNDKSSKKRKRTPDETEVKETVDDKEKKSTKKEKKRKRVEEETALRLGNEGTVEGLKSKKEPTADETSEETLVKSKGTAGIGEEPKKSKKERKIERKAREAAEKATSQAVIHSQEDLKPTLEHESNGSATLANSEEKKRKKNNRNRKGNRKAALENGADGKAPRFIAFIGMLSL
jgi:nucleolar protein 6